MSPPVTFRAIKDMLYLAHHVAEEWNMQAALGIDAAIDAKDLALLDSVFGEWCIKYNVLKSSPEAQVKARQIIDLFEHGWKTHAELSAMLGPLSGENA